MKSIATLIATCLVAAALPALAQHDHSAHGMSMGAASAPAKEFTTGDVKDIDKQAGKITLKHGAIANLGMPAMTMVFKAKDPAAIHNLKVGDAVAFKAESLDGVFTVTEIKPRS